ncbi:RNA-binding protein Musashi-like 2, partial [Ophiophagus hannah]
MNQPTGTPKTTHPTLLPCSHYYTGSLLPLSSDALYFSPRPGFPAAAYGPVAAAAVAAARGSGRGGPGGSRARKKALLCGYSFPSLTLMCLPLGKGPLNKTTCYKQRPGHERF